MNDTQQLQPQLQQPQYTRTFLERVADAQQLWTFVIPDVPMPPNLIWVRWLSMGTDRDVEKAITQIPYRFQKNFENGCLQTDITETVYKFVTSLLSTWRGKGAVKPNKEES